METIVHRNKSQIIVASSLDIAAGVWLIICPFVLHFDQVRNAAASDCFFGILIALLAAFRVFGGYSFSGISWINALFGVWILTSPFFLGFYRFHVPLINNIITGAAVIAFACWSAMATATERHPVNSILGNP